MQKSAKSINLYTIRKLTEYSLINHLYRQCLLLPFFEILLSAGRLVLCPAQRGTGSERVQASLKNKKDIGSLLKLLEKWLTYKLWRFWMVFNFCKNLFSTGKIEKLDFWVFPIITQTSNINSLRTTSAKSINLNNIRKIIEYSLKNLLYRQCLLLLFPRCRCPKVSWYYDAPTRAQGAKRLISLCCCYLFSFI